ncbi:MAG TPA: FUSC family protein, partial [Gaiellaceae bacterium]|nr:FUSC family protein [Gaiellaceae bacterium]
MLGRIAQAAAAAGIAWELALQLHPAPFFAPIAAVISLGAAIGRRGRQAIEMMTGVALGILLGAAITTVAGVGALQLVFATLIAFVLATAAGATPLVRNQAAASAILVVALHRPGQNLAIQRLEDALIGGAVAIVIARFLFPVHPVTLVRDEARVLRERVAAALDLVAEALAQRDAELAEEALRRIDAIDEHHLGEALMLAREVARAAPRRRPLRRQVEALGEVYRELEASVGDAHAVGTGAARLLAGGEDVPGAAEAA